METEEFEALKRDLNETFSHIEDIGERKKAMVSALKYLKYGDNFNRSSLLIGDPAYPLEQNDCSVRALSAFADIPYGRAHEIAEQAGRKDGDGANIYKVMAQAKKSGIACFGIRIRKDHPTVISFAKARTRGRYLLIVDKHGLALVDGVLFDNQCDSVFDLVQGYYTIPLDFHG